MASRYFRISSRKIRSRIRITTRYRCCWRSTSRTGCNSQAAYTYSKSLDNASSFESTLNPLNFNATYGPSLFDARHRFVFSYVWELPVPKFDGFKGQLLDGWQISGIVTFQTGFPVRITSSDDMEAILQHVLRGTGRAELGVGSTAGAH